MTLEEDLKCAVSDFQEKIRQVTIENLEKVNLDIPISLIGISEPLNEVYSQGLISDKDIEGAIEVAVLNKARSDYNFLIGGKRSESFTADHLSRPECFAYGISQRAFKTRELKKVPFEGETPQEFSRHYGNPKILEKLREELLNPPAFPVGSSGHSRYDECMESH